MSTAPENTVFSDLLADIMACRLCEDLPLGPKPVVQLNAKARILLVGQAPGKQAHENRDLSLMPVGIDYVFGWALMKQSFTTQRK